MLITPLVRWRIAEAVVITLLLFLTCLLFPPAPVASRTASRFSHCRNNLKLIELALHNYHDDYGTFPPVAVHGSDGQPWHSWRVLLLPYIDQQPLYEQYHFGEPWNGPHNRQLAARYPRLDVYSCPTDFDEHHQNTTSYLAVVGDKTMWPSEGSLSLTDVPDGADRTIRLVEVSNSGIHWMEPRDLRFEAMEFPINPASGVGIRSVHSGESRWGFDGPPRANVSFVDGSTRPLDTETPSDVIKSLLLRNDGGPDKAVLNKTVLKK